MFFDYKIPDEILSMIPDHFWAAFGGELISIFGANVFAEDDDGIRLISYHSGTSGWTAALQVTCDKLHMKWLWEYYKKLRWDESDMFDGEFEELIISNFIKRDSPATSSYYLWLVNEKELTFS